MKQHIAHISLLVKNYDEAIQFYTKKLHFELIEDIKLSESKRWVLIAPKGSSECKLLLSEAKNATQKHLIGNQSGGSVFLFLYTDNIARDYQNLIDQKIEIIQKPKTEAYGTVAVFADLYGNKWDLIEAPKQKS